MKDIIKNYPLPFLFIVFAASAILFIVYFYPKDRTPQPGTAALNITYGTRTMSVKEFKPEHERLAGYIVNLLIALHTNHVVIDGRSPGAGTSTNWQLRIMENPADTNQMTVSYEL